MITNTLLLATVIFNTNCLPSGGWANGNYEETCIIERQVLIVNAHLPDGSIYNSDRKDHIGTFRRTFNAAHQLISETPVQWMPDMMTPTQPSVVSTPLGLLPIGVRPSPPLPGTIPVVPHQPQ